MNYHKSMTVATDRNSMDVERKVQESLDKHCKETDSGGWRIRGVVVPQTCPLCGTKSYAMGSGMRCHHCGGSQRPTPLVSFDGLAE